MIVHVAVTRPTSWHTVRRVTHVSATRCTRPVRVTAGAGDQQRTTWVDCARRLPTGQRCRPCTTHLIPEVIDPPVAGEAVSVLVFPEDGPARR